MYSIRVIECNSCEARDSELRQVDLADLAGVSPKCARAAMRGKLAPASTADGTRVFRDHPLVIAYIKREHPGRRRALRAAEARTRQRKEAAPGIDPFAALTRAAPVLACPTATMNRAAVAAMELADLDEESESRLHQIKAGLLNIYIPIADREIRKHNGGMIPVEAAVTLGKLRAFASAPID